MRPVCFILCFTIGVCLMVFSGYLPQSASARGRSGLVTAHGAARTDSDGFTRSLTRRAATDRNPGDGPVEEDTPPPDPEPELVPPPTTVEHASKPPEQPARAAISELPPSPPPAPPSNEPPPPESPAPPPPADEHPTVEPAAPAARNDTWPLLADAGPDRVVWIGWDELALDGSASTGQGITYEWKQTSGPVTLAIANPLAPVTLATGLLNVERMDWRGATYEFQLTVTDLAGEREVDSVRYTVKSAPAVTVKPTAERRFEIRDGYPLAHFIAWNTTLDGDESVFEITSDKELTFTKVSGSPYTLTGGKTGSRFVYQVVVFANGDATTSWVELLVDTEEKVPGIVQLGVNWTAVAAPPMAAER